VSHGVRCGCSSRHSEFTILLSLIRSCRRLAALGVLIACAAALAPSAALADGDPASDVLIGQTLFLPADAGASVAQQSQLQTLLRAAAHAGYPIRVALIASPSDLGSVTALWHQPRAYARFLGYELALVFHGPLLVVMPSGYGLYHSGSKQPAEQTALAAAPTPGAGGALVSSAIVAVRRLAAATGHGLSRTVVNDAGQPGAPQGSGQLLSLVVFAAGVVLIALAWAASVRARPLRFRAPPESS
jgi:hypothetical protein